MTRDSSGKDESLPKEKKKKKVNVSSSPNKLSVDVYAETCRYEEEQAMKTSGEEDLVTFQETIATIKEHMKDILKLKTKKQDKAQESDLEQLKKAVALKFLAMKRLNRLEKYRLRAARDKTNEAKQRVDTFHLQLQNLLYEIIHLHKEVSRCRQFRSKDEDIDLVSVEDFYSESPADISKPELSKDDPHVQYLARLEWELSQRKQMAAQCEELEKLKTEVAQQIQEKQQQIDSILPRLKTVLAATKPLQEFLKMHLDEERAQHNLAYSLPEPLYVLYVQTTAYHEACDKDMVVTILGSKDHAESFNRTTTQTSAEESDSDVETEEQGAGEGRRERRLSKQKSNEDEQKHVLQTHPLTIQVEVRLGDGNALIMEFFYLVQLSIVSVKCRVVTSSQTPSVGQLVAADSVLACLFEDDLGDVSPNPASRYLLHRCGITDLSAHLSAAGRPYLWAQGLAGLDYMSSDTQDSIRPSQAVSVNNMETTMKAVRRRLKSRIALQREISSLEHCILHLPECAEKLFPIKTSSRLLRWQHVTWEDYQRSPATRSLVSAGLVTANHHFYKAVVDRSTAKLEALVGVAHSYPQTAPLFSLTAQFPTTYGVVSKDTVREMEMEINLGVCELVEKKDGLLSAQLKGLLVCMDILCESQAALTGAQVSKENIFFRATRGRSHSRPFKFVPKLGLFTHH